MPFLRNIVMLLAATLLFGCSFHSRQLNAIQQLVSRESDPLEEFAWTASWNGNQYRLYAIAVSENQTLFAFDSYYLLNIEGGYLQDVQGFLPNEDAGHIEMQGEELLYFDWWHDINVSLGCKKKPTRVELNILRIVMAVNLISTQLNWIQMD